jgi:hypothetical protein
MNEPILGILRRVASGRMRVDAAFRKLCAVGELGFAQVDHDRERRQGHPEIVYGPGKTPAQAARIAREIAARSGRVLVTRATPPQARAVKRALPRAVHDRVGRSILLLPPRFPQSRGILVVTAGTGDLPVAREVVATCRLLGHSPSLLADVGVAGVHRLLRRAAELRRARVVVAVAGMEGALASVVGGLVAAPVVGLPTSVGYGAGGAGLAALLSMMNSCAANVCCVNIDDGVGAGVVASLINAAPKG